MRGFTKLFASITESSIWGEDNNTLRVWICFLARCDAEGVVEGSIPGLAHLCRLSITDFKAALAKLEGPDEYSRTPDNEGRRIAPVAGGWRVLNYLAYREKGQTKDGSRAPYYRQYRQARQTQQDEPVECCAQQPTVACNTELLRVTQKQKQKQKQKTEAEDRSILLLSEAERGGNPPNPPPAEPGASSERRFTPPSREELDLEAAKIGLPAIEVDKFVSFYGSKGWKVGKTPMKSWRHSLTGWKLRWIEHVGAGTSAVYAPNGRPSGGYAPRIGTSTPSNAPFFPEKP